MTITLLITQPPESILAARAIDFARELCEASTDTPTATINRLFFYHQGVRQTRRDSPTATQWQQLSKQYQIPTTVCSGSAATYGITEESALLPIAGMGDWLMATLESDRLVTF